MLVWAVVLLAVLAACGHRVAEDDPTEVKRTEKTAPTESAAIHTAAPETTVPEPTVPEITAPEALCAVLEESGLSVQALTDVGCAQLVTVDSDGTSAQIDLYLLENNQWQRQELLSCGGYVGKNGTTAQKQEGDKATPKGLYPVEMAFYIAEAPQTGLSSFQITEDTYWVDDPESVYYNRRVEGTQNKDWTSAEHMLSYPASYEYGFVIGYNAEQIPNAGSAIFFHVSDHPTAGCIATDRAFVLQYLAALDEAKNPYILIN